MDELPEFDGVVLAGASSKRFGGADKALIELQGQSFLRRSLDALSAARRTVVVGPMREGFRPTVWADDGSSGGPVAALARGLSAARSEVVVVLAVDMPLVTQEHVAQLVQRLASGGSDGVALADASGRVSYLAGAYRRGLLTDRLRALPRLDGARLRDLVEGWDLITLQSAAARDCDSPQDLRRLATEGPPPS